MKTIYDKIEAGDYKPKVPHVRIKRFVSPTNDQLIQFMKTEGAELTLKRAETLYIEKQKQIEAETVAANEAYHKSEREGIAEFWNDIQTEYGMENHPMFPFMQRFAWERGHACGFYDTLIHFIELYETFKPIITGYTMVKK